MIVNIITSFESYGSEFQENIYKNDGSKTLTGMDFNDLETGVPSNTRFLYIRHDGMNLYIMLDFILNQSAQNGEDMYNLHLILFYHITQIYLEMGEFQIIIHQKLHL